jgi:hypothetical protein
MAGGRFVGILHNVCGVFVVATTAAGKVKQSALIAFDQFVEHLGISFGSPLGELLRVTGQVFFFGRFLHTQKINTTVGGVKNQLGKLGWVMCAPAETTGQNVCLSGK